MSIALEWHRAGLRSGGKEHQSVGKDKIRTEMALNGRVAHQKSRAERRNGKALMGGATI